MNRSLAEQEDDSIECRDPTHLVREMGLFVNRWFCRDCGGILPEEKQEAKE
jgi:hypothetical protein